MTIVVNRHIAGSFVTVFLTGAQAHNEAYIDARKDVRYPTMSFIEYVRAGQVRYRDVVPNYRAPERIMEMVRNILQGNQP